MNKNTNVIKAHLKFFIEPHPFFKNTKEKIFVPRKDYTIKFWIEGGLSVEGKSDSLDINFNDDELLILAIRGIPKERIIRIPWSRVIAFELIVGKDSSINSGDLIFLSPERNN
jgi:hypothetical protein